MVVLLVLVLILSSATVPFFAQEAQSTAKQSEVRKVADHEALEIEPVLILGTRGEYEAEASSNITILKKEDVSQSPMLVLDDSLRQIPGGG